MLDDFSALHRGLAARPHHVRFRRHGDAGSGARVLGAGPHQRKAAALASERQGIKYVADDLARWLPHKGMQHVRGAPYHPQTTARSERWHQTLKNRILLDNYYLPGDLERQIAAFVELTIMSAVTRASTI